MAAGHKFEEILEQELADAPRALSSSLYHYTSSDAAISGILATQSIKMSPFRGTNDLWESRPTWPNLEGEIKPDASPEMSHFGIWEEIDRYIRGYSKVACFTQDWELPQSVTQPDALRGWGHLSLWAHYGAAHAGVCLRFDRARLIAAFEAAGADAVHQFHGPVRYRGAEFGIGPYGISLEQAEEFGVDAVALRYAQVHRDRVFFRKHIDWASESEYRFVRTDLSTDPYYLDVKEALTGVVLGDAFPRERTKALLRLLDGFQDVEVLRANFHNRKLHLFPVEAQQEFQAPEQQAPVTATSIPPRRSGDLSQRLHALDEAERRAEIEQEKATRLAAPVLGAWREAIVQLPESYADWPDVVFNLHGSSAAIPPRDRRHPAGVPGETIAFEAGLMVVGEHQPQYSFTWVMAIALQLMPGGAARLHACITMEEWRPGGNLREDLYRVRRDAHVDDLPAVSRQVLLDLLEAVPGARSKFDVIRGNTGQ